ncbi:protein-glutamate O-methyltransferase CheR [Sphingomonas sp. So64.6b]|uniref:CheR family methyltransferase n=1 Tax=Sphingomonas sp. So64.6b TaxID=2997354 RepID=UPI001600FC6D|nr:protein-glutamate O-methyltransferase CheR [Sphingomonas sp. So64.6b]QNA86882.1 protein-glutamate O-methyltransferase CheR [Sphingomonas sp. So64.6b]
MHIFAALLEQRTGQQIAANREWRIETALKPVMRERGLETLDDLAGAIVGGRDPVVADQVVDALLNQESSFFRDAAVLDMIPPALDAMRAEGPTRRLRVWSAGCSMGQEPLSLAMLFAEHEAATGLQSPEIVATDVSENAISRARAGRFSQFEIQRGLPVRRMMRWFDTVGLDWIARPELVRRISFRRLNLVADPLPIGRFDVILCRNVLLYLSPSLRCQVLDRLAQVMRPGGLLVLGAGETVIGQTEAFRPSPDYRGLYEPTGIVSCGMAARA